MIAKTVARMRATSQHASRIALCLALLPFGCSGEGGSDGSGAQEIGFGFDETFGPGPVALSVRLGSREISLSDRLVCELELVTEAGLIAEFPECGVREQAAELPPRDLRWACSWAMSLLLKKLCHVLATQVPSRACFA